MSETNVVALVLDQQVCILNQPLFAHFFINRSLNSDLDCILQNSDQDWELFMPYFEYWINNGMLYIPIYENDEACTDEYFIITAGYGGLPGVPGQPSTTLHDDVIKRKHFPRYWPFVQGIHWSLVNSPHKGQWRRALMFSLICTCINGWVNNG